MPPPALKGQSVVLLIALLSTVFHLVLASRLGVLSSLVGSAIGDEGEEWRRLEGIQAIVSLARAWALLAAGVAALGLYGTFKEHPPFVRLFALSSFVSLALEALLSLMAIGLVFSSSSNSSSSSFIPSLCQSLSNADLSLESFFGWSAEQCEERFGSFLFTALSLLAVVSILRAGATVKVLSYYTHLSKRSRRKPALSIDIGRPGLARDRYSDRDDSASKRPHHHSAHRIFLLPDPVDSKKDDGPVAGVDVPLLSLTASSPATASFPPQPAGVSQLVPDEHAVPMASPQRFLVYAPVMMTPDEARRAGAREISLGGHSRPRSRSNVAAASPISPQPLSTTSETQTPLTAVPEVGAGNGKGKLA